MKKTTTLISGLLFAVTLFAPAHAAAQRRELPQGFRNGLSVEPLYLFVDGLRINYERQLQTPRHWIDVSAIGYARKNSENWENWFFNGYNTDRAWGLGAELNYKYFVLPFMYLSFGAGGGQQTVTYTRTAVDYSSYREDGLVFYEPDFDARSRTATWSKVAGNIRLGFQSKSTRRVLAGGYVGLGYVHSFYDSAAQSLPNNPLSLGFRGIGPHAGFRIGVRF
jgi:hypothetical protein